MAVHVPSNAAVATAEAAGVRYGHPAAAQQIALAAVVTGDNGLKGGQFLGGGFFVCVHDYYYSNFHPESLPVFWAVSRFFANLSE